ncbi:MAG: glutamine-hydrolyzing GMP synthase [Candidatus Levybacteria bacterium]|nr:glutamine-hydrolyzing GMP synthase [Candidatus Levybacteria bacterium]
MNRGKIFVVDFGGQTAHLITRRLKDLGVDSSLIDPDESFRVCSRKKPQGIIFSGGPASVYEIGAPTIDKKIFNLGIPILGICYGWQLMAHLLGGEVESADKEYGPTILTVLKFDSLFYGLPTYTKVIESHGDSVRKMPRGFSSVAKTETVKYAAVENVGDKLFGVQFHPEAHHSEHGSEMLANFATRICNLSLHPQKLNVEEMVSEIKEKVGNKKVIGAFSGGTDSAVAAALVAKAIGKNFIPFFVDSGLMREETIDRIKNKFPKILGVPVEIISARDLFLARLKGVVDPEEKRKKIGALYIELFERELKKHKDAKYLLQGTTYADFIHSQGSKRSAYIKSHHNVGGLPKKMKFKLLEPLRYFYTDQVREIGVKIGLPRDAIYQQPFPGPGHAVRIVGEVTKERLAKQVQADGIVVEEMRKSGWYKKVFQCWSVMTGTNSTGVKGDGRFYGEVVAVRIVNSKDRMSAEIARVPFPILEKIAARIVNEVPNVSRVVYDITSKPPATMEWE